MSTLVSVGEVYHVLNITLASFKSQKSLSSHCWNSFVGYVVLLMINCYLFLDIEREIQRKTPEDDQQQNDHYRGHVISNENRR